MLAMIAIRQNRAEDALSLVHEHVRKSRDLDVSVLTGAYFRVGYILARTGRPVAATRMVAASQALSEEIGVWMPWVVREAKTTATELRAQLGDAAFEGAWDTGRLLSRDEAVAFAVAETEQSLREDPEHPEARRARTRHRAGRRP
jgi:hypothetical protein